VADDNVTEIPSNNNGKKPRKPEDIIAEINGEFKAQKAKEFKTKATEVLKEIDLHEKNKALAVAKLEKLKEEFLADNK
jgi:hypothetical protein